jgi:N-acyl homoserine lactone hydrolase
MEYILQGRPVSLAILDFGLFRVHSNGRVIGICGYLIRTDRDELVLVDGGFPRKYTQDHASASTEDRLYEFGEVLSCGPQNTVAAQLQTCGCAPEDITLLIQTHTHIDHVGALNDAHQAPMLIAAAERALPKPLYWGGVQPLEWPDRNYIHLDEDALIGPSFRVMLVPGHAPGQLAMLIDLPRTGAVLLTSDAISRPAEIDEKFAGSMDEAAALASANRLMAAAAAQDAFIIYGHDPAQWDELRKAPDLYE